MTNETIQKEIVLRNLPVFTYINGKCRSCMTERLGKDEGRQGIYSKKTTVNSQLIKISFGNYEKLFGESLDTQNATIYMYIDSDGQLQRVEDYADNNVEQSISSEEFQIIKAKIQNNSKDFVEKDLDAADDEEVVEGFKAILQADNESDFIKAINNFRDLYGMPISKVAKNSDLAKVLDNIRDTYKPGGDLRNICNIITVLK